MTIHDLNTASHLFQRRTLGSVSSARELRLGSDVLKIQRQQRLARRRHRWQFLRSVLPASVRLRWSPERIGQPQIRSTSDLGGASWH